MKPTPSRTVGSSAGWLLPAALGLLLWLAASAAAGSEVTPPQQPAPKKTQAAPAKAAPAKPVAAKPAAAKPKPAAVKPAPKKAAPTKRAAAPTGVLRRRDPFRSLVLRPEDVAGGKPLPPGKRGLVIAQVNLNGIVLDGGTGNLAVVTMPGRNRAYFLRARDELFDGYVSEIRPDAVVFKEKATDPFGREYEREVVKPLPGLTKKSPGSGAQR